MRRTEFEKLGYVALPAFLSGSEIAELFQQIQRYIETVATKVPRGDVFYEERENPETLKQMTRMNEHDAWFRDLLERGRFSQLASELLGEAAVAKNLQYFNKPVARSSPTPPHQDGFYFMLQPNQALTMWLALDPVDESNGCVRYVPGSHQRGLRPHARTQTLGFSQGIADYGDADVAMEIAMSAAPGDLLAHHSLTIHRADGNSSARPRRSLGFIYYGESAREDVAAHEQYQRQLKEELARAGRI